MGLTAFKRDILKELDSLPPGEQRRVLDFAKALAQSKPKGTPGRELVKFAGIIPREDIEEMERAIEEGCERVDRDGW